MPGPIKGRIFDILRASVNDGPGIRTTVFFKGCPLRCSWCHNPESWSSLPQLSYNREKCTHCLSCVEVCPTGAHLVQDRRHAVRFEQCIACGKCVKACRYGALRIIGDVLEVNEVFEEIRRDKDFFEMSGGGVTLTGGEPLLQMKFVLELLKRCKTDGLHTCVETCGYVPRKNLELLLPFVDLFLFDYKATNNRQHKMLTGAPNKKILENLDFLYQKGAEIILRCPMVPGLNDTEEHRKGIAAIHNRYPRLKGIEIMSYHNMGVSKASCIGAIVDMPELMNTTQEQKDKWAAQLREYGCDEIKIN